MTKQVSDYTTASELRSLMDNAKRLGRQDVWNDAFRRLCHLQGLDQSDPLHCAFYQTLAAYEQLLTEKNGRNTPASRTRQKLRNKGVVQCLEDWAVSRVPTDGYNLLIQQGMPELTGEYIVLRYPNRFSERAQVAARDRLSKSGVAPPA